MANHDKIESKKRSAKMDAINAYKVIKRIPHTDEQEAKLVADAITLPDDIATKADIDKLEKATKSDIKRLETKITKLETETQSDIKDLKTETKSAIDKLEAATKLNSEKMKNELIRWNLGIALVVTSVIALLIKF